MLRKRKQEGRVPRYVVAYEAGFTAGIRYSQTFVQQEPLYRDSEYILAWVRGHRAGITSWRQMKTRASA